MKTLSMLEFRRHARKILRAIERGERLILTYRGKAIARLEPIVEEPPAIPPDDPIYHLDDYTYEGPPGGQTNEDIDRTVYEY